MRFNGDGMRIDPTTLGPAAQAQIEAAQPTKKRSKYGAEPMVVDGVRFASKGEARRWLELKSLENVGKISHLERQVRFQLYSRSDAKISSYVADFVYFDGDNRVVEDFKGHRTREYKMKKKWLEADYPGLKILETGSKPRKQSTLVRGRKK